MSRRDIGLVLVVCLLWGFNFVAASVGVEAFSPVLLLSLRFTALLALTWPFLRRPPAGQWPRLAGAALAIGIGHFAFLFWALQHSSDVTSIVILQHTYIPMAVLLGMLVLGEKAGWRTLASIGLAMAGVVLIGFDPLVLGQPTALALALVSAFFQAAGSLFQRGLKGVSVLGFQAWTAAFSLPLLLLATLLFTPDPLAQLHGARAVHWISLAYTVLGASLLGHGLFFFLVQRNPLPRLMPYLLLTPLFGAAFGVLVWGDRPGWRLLLGGAMVLLGILIVTLRGRARGAALITEPE